MMNKIFLSMSCFIVAVITVFRYDVIIAGIISLAAWCVTVLTHPGLMVMNWSLVEYWVASVVWIGVMYRLATSMFLTLRYPRRPPNGLLSPSSHQLSAWIILIVAGVALASPILMPVDPNVQGNLVTTRLLPPISTGYVREHIEERGGVEELPAVQRVFLGAREYLLGRTVSLSGSSLPMIDRGEAVHVVRDSRIIFLLGTDDNGRDVFSRMIAGAKVSLGIGLCAALGALLIGSGVGFVAGMYPGFIDAMLMRLTDVFLAIPGLFLVIGALAFVGESMVTIVVLLSVTGWMGIARVIRGEVVSLREREFILTAKLLRVPAWGIIIRHLIPNLRPVLLVSAVVQFANAVLGEAALGFLGLGVQPPTATWGNMMGEATGYLDSAWWMGFFPGLLLATIIVVAHSFGDRTPGQARGSEPVIDTPR